MILPDNQREVKCATCEKTAYRQELPVHHVGQGTHLVIYETHDPSLSGKAHIAALGRMDAFFKKVHAIMKALNRLPREQRAVETGGVKGELVEFDFGPVMPDACHVRVEVKPEAYIKAFGQIVRVEIPRRSLKGLRVDRLLKEFKEASTPAIEDLKRRRASGEI